jgi:hypothetical protein
LSAIHAGGMGRAERWVRRSFRVLGLLLGAVQAAYRHVPSSRGSGWLAVGGTNSFARVFPGRESLHATRPTP